MRGRLMAARKIEKHFLCLGKTTARRNWIPHSCRLVLGFRSSPSELDRSVLARGGRVSRIVPSHEPAVRFVRCVLDAVASRLAGAAADQRQGAAKRGAMQKDSTATASRMPSKPGRCAASIRLRRPPSRPQLKIPRHHPHPLASALLQGEATVHLPQGTRRCDAHHARTRRRAVVIGAGARRSPCASPCGCNQVDHAADRFELIALCRHRRYARGYPCEPGERPERLEVRDSRVSVPRVHVGEPER